MRRTAVLALAPESSFREDLSDVVQDLGYDAVHATDRLDAQSLCSTLSPSLVLAETSPAYTEDAIRELSQGAELLIVLEPGPEPNAKTVENWIHFTAPSDDPGGLARNLHLLTLARKLQLPIHVEKQQLAGRVERKSLLVLAQELAAVRFTGRVEVEDGSFFFSSGEIIEARCRPVNGEKAFYRLVRCASGAFTVQPGPVVIDRRIRTQTAELIAAAIGEILVQHPPNDLSILVNPNRAANDDLSGVQLKILEIAGRNPVLQTILDAIPEPDGQLLEEIVHLQQAEQILVDNPATSVRIVTDSAVDLPQAALDSPLLEILELPLLFSDHSAATGLEDPIAFYRHLRDGRKAPELAPATADALLRLYRNLLPKQDLVSIHVSDRLSETKELAFRSAQRLLQSPSIGNYKRSAPRLKVIDTQSASLGTGLLVLFATRMAARGKKADFIAQRISRMRLRTISLFGIGDAGYFARHGGERLGAAWRRSGSTPILSMANGVLETVAKVDTPHDIERRLSETLRNSLEPGTPLVLGIAHAAARQSARLLGEIIDRDFKVLETVEGSIGPLIGRLTGPGTISATVFVPEPAEIPWIQPIGDLQADFQ